jgi:Asp-tRNA(Asn)/Glu-tRNA(Gln) amidotransferase A subunit family amidase
MRDKNIEAILCPTYASCAFKSENVDDMGSILDYTMLWNCFDLPAGVIPVTKV